MIALVEHHGRPLALSKGNQKGPGDLPPFHDPAQRGRGLGWTVPMPDNPKMGPDEAPINLTAMHSQGPGQLFFSGGVLSRPQSFLEGWS